MPRPKVIALTSGVPPIERLPADATAWSEQHETAWKTMLDANPRLHDGPIWSVVEADAARLTVRADRYKRLAVQDDATIGGLGVRQLGVKGLVVGHDKSGTPRLLLARRGSETRIYAGMWEIAPGGGVDPRAAPSAESIAVALGQEFQEELGLELPASARPMPVALIDDPIARSVDVLLRVDWPGVVSPRAGLCGQGSCSWEYVDAVWISAGEVGEFAARSADAISPPTVAVLAWMGWLSVRG